jgi:predicted DNA-binding protein
MDVQAHSEIEIQIRLTGVEAERLMAEAARQGISTVEMVRAAIEAVVSEAEAYPTARAERFARLREAAARNAAYNRLSEAEADTLVEAARSEGRPLKKPR